VAVKVRRMRTVRLGNDGVCMKDFEKPGRRWKDDININLNVELFGRGLRLCGSRCA
jgi:hypothetical protein